MNILAIESSCDETAAAIIKDGQHVLANSIASQADLHAKTGGVVPEAASREHVLKIIPVIKQTFEEANVNESQIDAIAVTQGPGLIVCLLIGTNTAMTLAEIYNKPLIPVHHIEGHIYSNWLIKDTQRQIEFPILVLTVSGGHNELILMKNHQDYEIIGTTLDDAAGEAFDKVARLLDLGYPGGPRISKAAEKGDPRRFDLPRALMKKNNFDFSFSGLKTAVLKVKMEVQDKLKTEAEKQQFKFDLAASFQEAVNDALSRKFIEAVKKHNVKEAHLAGGVSANLNLREKIKNALPKDIVFRHPADFSFCTDNAAMIGAAAYFKFQKHPESYKQRKPVIAHADFKIGEK